MRTITKKTWKEIEANLRESFRKWHVRTWTIDLVPTGRDRTRMLSPDQARVSITFYVDGLPITLVENRALRCIDNFARLANTIEWVRTAHSREIAPTVTSMFRQMYPQPVVYRDKPVYIHQASAQEPYKTLHVTEDAPIEVVSAARKALILKHHPDVGGSHENAAAINAAYDKIAKLKGK